MTMRFHCVLNTMTSPSEMKGLRYFNSSFYQKINVQLQGAVTTALIKAQIKPPSPSTTHKDTCHLQKNIVSIIQYTFYGLQSPLFAIFFPIPGENFIIFFFRSKLIITYITTRIIPVGVH